MRIGIVWALLLTGCSGDGDDAVPTGVGACDESDSEGDCIAYTGSGWTEDDVASNCSTTPVPSCPTAGQIGSCLIAEGEENETISYFYEPQWFDTEAERACTSSGGSYTPL